MQQPEIYSHLTTEGQTRILTVTGHMAGQMFAYAEDDPVLSAGAVACRH